MTKLILAAAVAFLHFIAPESLTTSTFTASDLLAPISCRGPLRSNAPTDFRAPDAFSNPIPLRLTQHTGAPVNFVLQDHNDRSYFVGGKPAVAAAAATSDKLISFQADQIDYEIVENGFMKSELYSSQFAVSLNIHRKTSVMKMAGVLVEAHEGSCKAHYPQADVKPGNCFYRLKRSDSNGILKCSHIQNVLPVAKAKIVYNNNPTTNNYCTIRDPRQVKKYVCTANGRLILKCTEPNPDFHLFPPSLQSILFVSGKGLSIRSNSSVQNETRALA